MANETDVRSAGGWNRSVKPVEVKRPVRKVDLRILGGAIAVVAAVVLAAVLWPTGGGEPQAEGKAARRGRLLQSGRAASGPRLSPKEAVRAAMDSTKAGKKGTQRKRRKSPFGYIKPENLYKDLKGADRKFAEDLQKALDDDDSKLALKVATAAMDSKNPQVRLYAVDAFGWFGAEMLPELTAAMGDPDSDVAEAAEDSWEHAVDELEDAGERFAITAAALSTLSNSDQLTSISGILSGAADEFIDGPDDEAECAKNRLTVVQALVDIIETGAENNVEQAKEVYSEITGEDWESVDAAEAYLYDQYDYDAAADAAQGGEPVEQ